MMMKLTVLVYCLIGVLVMAAPALATAYLYDDFEDGDVSDWTFDTTAVYDIPTSPLDTLRQGTGHNIDAYDFPPNPGKQFRFYDDSLDDARWGTFTKPLDNDALSDTVYMSVDLTHAGGYVGDGGGIGRKQGLIEFMNTETDMGVRIFYALTKKPEDVSGDLAFGCTQGATPRADLLTVPDIGLDDDYDRHFLELEYDRLNGVVTVWWEGSLEGQFAYAQADNDQIKDFDYIRWSPHRPWVMDDFVEPFHWSVASTVLLDNIYVGDQPIPEPASATLLAIGLSGLMWRRRRR